MLLLSGLPKVFSSSLPMKSTRKSLSSISVALLGSTTDEDDDDDADEDDDDDEDKLVELLLWRFDPLFLF